MGEKIQAMLGSVRFWYAVILAVALLLDESGIITGAYAIALEAFAGLGITVRTIDKLAKK